MSYNLTSQQSDALKTLQQNLFMLNPKHVIEHLYARKAMTQEQRDTVTSKGTKMDQSRVLLNILEKQKSWVYCCFLEGLEKTGQRHVVDILGGGRYINGSILEQYFIDENMQYLFRNILINCHLSGSVRESKEAYERIRIHHFYFAMNLDLTELLDHLLENNVITSLECEEIKSGKTSFERNTCLLHLIPTKSHSQIEMFICCLRKTNQSHLAQLISSSGKTEN